MSRADSQAFPIPADEDHVRVPGLTIREHFAAMAMQGLLAKYRLDKPEDFETVSQVAVRQADFLIAELAKPVSP